MLRLEIGFILIALAITFFRPAAGSAWFGTVESTFSRLAQRRRLTLVIVGLTPILLRVALLPILPVPQPIVHDEFGYLLTADTFAHWRLANPTPPMWVHFETFHALFHPMYAAIYPPAQGFFLFLGKLLTGSSFAGVCLTIGLMCAAITWMLQGWMNPSWALLGGMLTLLRYGIFGYWANSYWGGAVAAIGGALVFGSLPRINQFQRLRDALLMGVGLAILANSRPYEGFIFSLPIAVMLCIWLLKKRRIELRHSLRQVVLPLAIVLSLTGAGMGYYFWRVTGNPVRMPYQIERSTYAIAPYLIWQSVRPEPVYHHATMRKMFVDEEMLGLNVFRSATGVLLRVYLAWSFYLGPALTLPFLLLPLTLPRNFSLKDIEPMTGALVVVLTVSVIGSFLVNFYSAHYSAPNTGLIIAAIVLSIRQLRTWGRSGLFLSRAIPVICVVSLVARAAAVPFHIPLREFYEYSWYQKGPPNLGRADVERKLHQIPGNHLVIVRYKPEHEPFAEWVYNQADIDHARVIWAREMAPSENQELLDYFKDRRIWLLEADENPARLSAYITEPNSASYGVPLKR